MNQNQPPRDPCNPFYSPGDNDNQGTNPSPQQNQQSPYPAPPQGGHNPWGHTTPSSGYQPPPVTPPPSTGYNHGYAPRSGSTHGHGYASGFGSAPGHVPAPGHAHPYPPPLYGGTLHDTAPMATKDWVLTIIITFIPCINIVMLFIWAFSSSGNLNRRNYCRAYLLILAVVIGVSFAAPFIFGFGMGFFRALWWI